MTFIILRTKLGESGPDDLKVSVQERTYEYLMSTITPEVRISAFFDVNIPEVAASYEEAFVAEDCPFVSTITKIIPGSRKRKDIVLPGPMNQGEQLTILVDRKRK